MSPTFVHINRKAELEKTRQIVTNRRQDLIERTTLLAGKLETTRHNDALSSRLEPIFQNIFSQLELVETRLDLERQAAERIGTALTLAQELQALIRQSTILTSETLTESIEDVRLRLHGQGSSEAALERFNQLADQEFFDLETMNELMFRSANLIDFLQRLETSTTLAAVAKLKEDFNFNLRAIIRLLINTPSKAHIQDIARLVRALSELTKPEDDFFQLRTEIVTSSQELADKSKQSEHLNSALGTTVEQLVQEAQQDVGRATHETNTVIAFVMKTLLAIGLASLLLSVSISVLYIYRSVMRRLHHLSTATRSLASGNLDIDIDQSGHDELADMAEAVQVFKENAILLRDNEQTLREQAHELERANVELARSNEDLDRFAYVASHDLKAPLRAIRNLATWIVEDAGDVLPEASRDDLALLQQRVERMDELLESLLQYSRIGRVTTPAEIVDTKTLVIDTLALFDMPPGFTVEVAPDIPSLYASPAALQLVFRNLVGNAIKHHKRQDGCVMVSGRECGAYIEFAVADDGPGIAEAYHDRIFQMFQTLQPRDEVEGSGMGLALVKKMIEVHGGSINVESEAHHGTTFRFVWPKQEHT